MLHQITEGLVENVLLDGVGRKTSYEVGYPFGPFLQLRAAGHRVGEDPVDLVQVDAKDPALQSDPFSRDKIISFGLDERNFVQGLWSSQRLSFSQEVDEILGEAALIFHVELLLKVFEVQLKRDLIKNDRVHVSSGEFLLLYD